ncbi:thioesterase-like superfamily-domain-containing protein [Lasiosphaeria miniovina]|uniref:Thioesterase-like superfamily-domain-containing protein n=1 Tax=Lasiosphaeria miniovina TaxID=1954250 RepID=A0AA39ZUZ4_9PEZI|nr:thioesterase-like superfamily-domain-containing protein [Lasiosphaeria miniovina]KAK0704010.1 thioesterase-like superfamily-domain-containing protein [Lasiosphaeria miniovina]
MASEKDPRLPFQEALDIVRLPNATQTQSVHRFMGQRAAYVPGSDMPPIMPRLHIAAFGGHVFAQAGLAVCRARKELEDKKGTKPSERRGLHTIHGFFTASGIHNRPFIHEVTPLTATRSLSTLSVTTRQPSEPSTNPSGDNFPLADALLPLGDPCFTAVCSFKLPEEHSAGVDMQDDAPQKRFASILASRQPQDWLPVPPVDVTGMVAMAGNNIVGAFPVVDMKKVDMKGFNAGKPAHERRELILYRLLLPLPSDGSGSQGWNANAHVLVHAFAADRNGLLMGGNHVGFGWSLDRAASLSNSFVMHVNADCAVMRAEDGWWVQEFSFPRAAAGRITVMSKIWSPRGVHVATEFQDGMLRGREDVEEKGKL